MPNGASAFEVVAFNPTTNLARRNASQSRCFGNAVKPGVQQLRFRLLHNRTVKPLARRDAIVSSRTFHTMDKFERCAAFGGPLAGVCCHGVFSSLGQSTLPLAVCARPDAISRGGGHASRPRELGPRCDEMGPRCREMAARVGEMSAPCREMRTRRVATSGSDEAETAPHRSRNSILHSRNGTSTRRGAIWARPGGPSG